MNFSFLNPMILWALPLSLLPVVFHLFLKRPPKTVVFSDLRLLTKVFERYQPRKRLKEWLILLLRVLTILALFLFFSRPVLHWGGSLHGGDSTALVILIDASYSMRYQESGRSNWERAQELAQITLKSLKERDRSALIIFSD